MCSVLSLLSLSFWLFVVFILAVLQFLAVLSEWWMNHFAQNTYNKGWGFYLGLYGLVFTTGSVMMVVARGMYALLCAIMRYYALVCQLGNADIHAALSTEYMLSRHAL